MEKLKMIDKLKKAAIFLGVFVLGVALGAWGGKLLTKKGEENVFFRQRQSEYQFINPLLDFAPLKDLFCNQELEFGLTLSDLKIAFENLGLSQPKPALVTCVTS